MSQTEEVLCIPTSLFERLGKFQGFRTNHDGYLDRLLVQAAPLQFVPRSVCEQDTRLKQIIPYILVGSRGTPEQADHWHLLCYRRGNATGDARLRAKWSIGVGGHVNRDDDRGTGVRICIWEAIDRELDEELVLLGTAHRPRVLGLINDDSDPVGAVHLGIVLFVEADMHQVQVRDDALTDASFVGISQLREIQGRLESWSQICLDHVLGPQTVLDGLLPWARPL